MIRLFIVCLFVVVSCSTTEKTDSNKQNSESGIIDSSEQEILNQKFKERVKRSYKTLSDAEVRKAIIWLATEDEIDFLPTNLKEEIDFVIDMDAN
ncbi:MAG: hypothetical protein ACRCTJ_00180, partial [Brevinema sp.]